MRTVSESEARKYPNQIVECAEGCGSKYYFPRILRCPRCHPTPRKYQLVDLAAFAVLIWWFM